MLPMSFDEALRHVQQAFPSHDVSVEDGDWLEAGDIEEVGVITDSTGEQVASFSLISWQSSGISGDPPLIDEIRIGRIGQYCGRSDEFREFQAQRAVAMG